MDEDQLDELDMHIAAGVDYPTAWASVGDEPPQGRGSSVEVVIGLLVALLFILGWFWLQ